MKFDHIDGVSHRRNWLKLLLIIIPIVLVFIGISLFAVNRWYNDNLMAVDSSSSESLTFVIEPGSSARDIADELKILGLIKNATAFSWYVDRNDSRQLLQAGTYSISPSLSVEEIVNKLVAGDVDTSLVTIFPGRRLDQINGDLIDAGFNTQEVESALNGVYDSPVLADKPLNLSLEGYIYPETYQITADSSLDQVISRAIDQLWQLISEDDIAALDKRDLDLHQAVTLASIIYLESSDELTQQKIAGVFYNRLDQGLPLGSDPTFKYAAAISGQEVAVDIDSPYNTRIVTGLPPGPISNFNISAFEALVTPVETDFLYFVAGDDGNTYFARTFAEHEDNIARYCIELCRLP